jgi:signal transduction histidine kinase
VTLRFRLALGLAAVAVLLAAPLVLALRALRDASASAGRLRGQEVAAALMIGRSRAGTAQARAADITLVFVPEDTNALPYLAQGTRALRTTADSLSQYNLDAEAAVLRASARRLDEVGPRERAAAAAGDTARAGRISELEFAPAVRDAEAALTRAERALRQGAEERSEKVRDAAAVAVGQALALFAAAAAGAIAVSVWLTRSISGPVRDLVRGMAAVAGGRFDHRLRVATSRPDEFGALAVSYDAMTERLAELDRIKAEFVSVASHELKTPINVMLGYVALVQEGLYGPVTTAQADVLRTVEAQGQQLARLVQHLLDVSRFRAGAGRIEPRPVALRPFLGDLERAHAVLARQRGLTLTLAADAALPEVVSWDVDRMSEVLGNLLSNAVKFTPEGGRVSLIAEPAPDLAAVDLKRPGPALRLVVEDTGVGIAPAQLPHIFDKFYQADNQARASAAGTGLGLAIAKQIVEAHGGVIGVESTPEVGTRFVMLVPVDAAGTVTPALGVPAVGSAAPSGAPSAPARTLPATAAAEPSGTGADEAREAGARP